jgi:argininosuccinate lyase
MTDSDAGSRAPRALWSGRIQGGMAPEMVPLNRSLDVDRRLWRQDIRGSRAWARALSEAGVISGDEARALDEGLLRVEARLGTGEGADAADEDIHSLVERLLFEEAGPVAGKLHTGRSRNDQVATDLRLWGMETCRELEGLLGRAMEALVGLARRSGELILPGYTHLQQGQPVLAAHWALAHFWPLARDRGRLRGVATAASVLPLGSGAIAGCPFPVDRGALRDHLGFEGVSPNSMDAVSDRDWVAELVFAGGLLGVHLSRLAEDLVLYSSMEFGFVRLGDGYSTGSSLMPQKRNPDVAELVRGKSGRLVGNVAGFLTLLKGLPTSYNRDLQEDKSLVFDTVDTLRLILPAMAGAVETMEWRADRVAGALDTQLLATDLADYLVRRGVPFRTSHEVIATLVRISEERRTPLASLPDEVFQEAHEAFGGDVREVFDWLRSVDARAVPGGTARTAVEEQLELAAAVLEG